MQWLKAMAALLCSQICASCWVRQGQFISAPLSIASPRTQQGGVWSHPKVPWLTWLVVDVGGDLSGLGSGHPHVALPRGCLVSSEYGDRVPKLSFPRSPGMSPSRAGLSCHAAWLMRQSWAWAEARGGRGPRETPAAPGPRILTQPCVTGVYALACKGPVAPS